MPTSLAADATSCRTRSSTTAPPACGLQHGGIGLGDAIDPVFPLDQLSRAFAHRRTDSRVGKGLERGEQCVLLVLVHRHLDHRIGGELREPADVADDQRLSQREGADRAPGGFAHRRRAERDDRVAGRHQRPELVLGHVLAVLDSLRKLQAAEPHRERADQQEPRAGPALAQPFERRHELRDALGLVQVAEAAVQRHASDIGRLRSPAAARPDAGSGRSARGSPIRARAARRSASGRSARWRGRAPRRRAGNPRAASPTGAAACCRARRRRAAVRPGRPRAPSPPGSRRQSPRAKVRPTTR